MTERNVRRHHFGVNSSRLERLRNAYGSVHNFSLCGPTLVFGFTLWLALSPLANFTENWLNKNFEFWTIFANFPDSCRNQITIANLAKLILMLAGTQELG